MPPSLLLSVFEIKNGYFLPGIIFSKHNKLIYFVRWKNTKKMFINIIIIYFFKYFFNLKIRNTFDIFLKLNRSPIKSMPLFTT